MLSKSKRNTLETVGSMTSSKMNFNQENNVFIKRSSENFKILTTIAFQPCCFF